MLSAKGAEEDQRQDRVGYEEEDAAHILSKEDAHDLKFLFDVFRKKFEFFVEVIFLLV